MQTHSENYGCPPPCTQISYKYNIQYFSKNSWIDTNSKVSLQFNDIFYMDLFYETQDVEERIESLVYDMENFLAVTGGNLVTFSQMFLGKFYSNYNFYTYINIVPITYLKTLLREQRMGCYQVRNEL